MNNVIYPFPAIVGQEKLKKAILLNIINPKIRGVLISGEKGTAKSTIVRSISSIAPWLEIIELPLNITEDRLVGSINIEKAILHGEKTFEGGLLQKAHKNLLYIDEVNLLSESVINSLLEVVSSGENIVEREGISYSHPSKFVLIGTMNPEEGDLRSQFIDKFGLYVQVEGEKDLEKRKEIIYRRLEYEKNPQKFCKTWQEKCREYTKIVQNGLSLIKDVIVSDEMLNIISKIVNHYNCQGNKAEIIMVETSKAIAALDARNEVCMEDINEAVQYVLPHRASKSNFPKQKQNDSDEDNTNNQDNNQNEDGEEENNNKDNIEQKNQDYNENLENPSSQDETINEIGKVFKVKNILNSKKDRIVRKGSGKRLKSRTNLKEGRYTRYRLKNGKINDIALDGTIRAAAPFQKMRNRKGVALSIRKSDLREKVREKRTGTTIIFVVDASGSICANKRMEAAKGAIMSLLTDAYEKRDKVAMIAFRKNSAEVLLQVTRSVDLAHKCLKDLPSGGKTPLASGLESAYKLIKTQSLKDKEMIPFIVLISDGRANVSLDGGDPFKESLEIGNKIALEGIKNVIIDTESGFIKFGTLKKLASVMNSKYYKIEDLNDKQLANTVRKLI